MGLSRSQMAALLTQAQSRLQVMHLRIDHHEWPGVYEEVGKAITALNSAGELIRDNKPFTPPPAEKTVAEPPTKPAGAAKPK